MERAAGIANGNMEFGKHTSIAISQNDSEGQSMGFLTVLSFRTVRSLFGLS
jgi:hypothetical protein